MYTFDDEIYFWGFILFSSLSTTSASTFLADGHFCIYILYIHISHFYFLDLLRAFLFVWREVLMGDSMLCGMKMLWCCVCVKCVVDCLCYLGLCWFKSSLVYYFPPFPFPLSLSIYQIFVLCCLLLCWFLSSFICLFYLVFPIISWSLLNFDGINLTLIN